MQPRARLLAEPCSVEGFVTLLKVLATGNFSLSSRSSDIDHKMLDLSVIKSSDEKKNCPRCGGQVSTDKNILYHPPTLLGDPSRW